MKVFLLCGGRGERLNGLDMPKPMCIVRGKSIIYHVIDGLPLDIKEITIVYTNYLNKYELFNFLSNLLSLQKHKHFRMLQAGMKWYHKQIF